jgi:hypothetical protein
MSTSLETLPLADVIGITSGMGFTVSTGVLPAATMTFRLALVCDPLS